VRLAIVLAASVLAAAPARAAASPAVVTVAAPAATMTISAADVHHWLRIARATAGGPGVPRRVLDQQVLQLLVRIDWVDGEAAEQGITVTGAEVQQTFDQERRESFPNPADYRRFLRQSRQTTADILIGVRNQLLSDRLRDRVVTPAAAAVTDAQVDAAVQRAGPEIIPETRDIRLVRARSRAVARRRLAHHGGQLWRRASHAQLGPRLGRAAFRAVRGRVVGPVRVGADRLFLKVVRIHPRHVKPLARQRAEIRAELVSDAEQRALDAFVDAFQAKWRARTTCAAPYVWFSDCANWDGTPDDQPRASSSAALSRSTARATSSGRPSASSSDRQASGSNIG
jgi:parvulin-like peptidyl-prolyl isomerase